LHLHFTQKLSTEMSSCDVNPPLAFQAGICSGVGVCVNSTNTPGRLLCRCNNGYSGASDYFDNRIELLPDGSYLSLDCGESKLGTCVIWGLVLFITLIRTKQIMMALYKFYRLHITDERKRKAGFFSDFPLRTLTFDLFVPSLLGIVVSISKLCGLVFGSDVLPTVCVSLLVLSFNQVNFEIGRREFSIFIQGTMSSKSAASIRKFRTGLKVVGIIVYASIATVPGIWALTLDKTLGPIENDEFYVILIRNIGTISWGILDICSVWMVKNQLERSVLLTSSDNNKQHSSDSQPPSSNKPTKAVEVATKRLALEIRSLLLFMLVMALLFGVFSIPILYPYQTYCLGFVIGMGAFRHSGKSFVEADAALKQSTSTVAVAEGGVTGQDSSFKSNNADPMASPK
jgi:hypothetical protein